MAEREDWCDIHKCSMQRYEKEGRAWHSHKTEDPVYESNKGWCSGKPPRERQTTMSVSNDVWKERTIRAKAPSIFFDNLKEWDDYVILGKKPLAQQETPPSEDDEKYTSEFAEEEPPF